jgi:hypothetical protein
MEVNTSNCSISLRGKGLCFDLNARTRSEISAPIRNLVERFAAIASMNGNFNKSFNVSLRDLFCFQGTLCMKQEGYNLIVNAGKLPLAFD